MAFKVRLHDSLGESVRRVACDAVEGAIAACASRRVGKGSPVWETRKHLKRARAALRLLRDEVPRQTFRREDHRLRKVGRLISDIRDAEVRLSRVKELRGAFGATSDRNFQETEELLAFELDNFLAAFDGWQNEAMDDLRRAHGALEQWQLGHVTSARILRSLRRSYKRGRDALELAKEGGDPERFHDLRKRTKTLWYQLRLLRPLQPEVFRDLSRTLKELSADLGHAHDLCFVAERLQGLAGKNARKRARHAFQTLIASREQDLQRKATRTAERFYAPRPREFAARLEQHFQNWIESPQRNDRSAAPNWSMPVQRDFRAAMDALS